MEARVRSKLGGDFDEIGSPKHLSSSLERSSAEVIPYWKRWISNFAAALYRSGWATLLAELYPAESKTPRSIARSLEFKIWTCSEDISGPPSIWGEGSEP